MASEKHTFECDSCKTRQIFYRRKINHPLHIALVIVTGGLWLISYIAIIIGHPIRHWTCAACDHIQKEPPKVNARAFPTPKDWKDAAFSSKSLLGRVEK